MLELIDHVNRNNIVIGQTTRDEAHHLGYPHRIVAVFVFNEVNELLVNRRKEDGLWDHSVGGHVSAGENILTAARREAEEEIGLPTSAELKFAGTFFLDESIRNEPIYHWHNLFITKEKNFIPIINKKEVLQVEWTALANIIKAMRDNSGKFALGFLGTMNYYMSTHQASFKRIPIR